MGGQTKLPLEVIKPVAEKLLAVLDPHCEQIAIAGSIRRNKPEVGDIELVAIPKMKAPAQQYGMFGEVEDAGQETSLLDLALDALIADQKIRRDVPSDWDTTLAWGERQKKFWVGLTKKLGWFQVDLFIVLPPAQWGAQFAIRTGSGDFNQALMRYINKRTDYKQDDGRLVHRETGEPALTLTEAAYFGALGLPVIPPHERSDKKLYEVVRALDAATETVSEPAPAPTPEAGQREITSTAIRRELAKLPGLHSTVLIKRIGCTVDEFRGAIWALKDLGTVKERLDCYWLAEDYPHGASSQPVEPAIQTIPDERIRSIILSRHSEGVPQNWNN